MLQSTEVPLAILYIPLHFSYNPRQWCGGSKLARGGGITPATVARYTENALKLSINGSSKTPKSRTLWDQISVTADCAKSCEIMSFMLENAPLVKMFTI